VKHVEMLQSGFDQFGGLFVKLTVFGFESAKANSVPYDAFVVAKKLRYSLVGFWPMVFGFLAERRER